MTRVITRVKISTFPWDWLSFAVCSFIIWSSLALITNHDFRGLHAFGVNSGTENGTRASPTDVDQFGLAHVRGSIEGEVVGRVALGHVEVQIIALVEEDFALAVVGPGQSPGCG